MLGGVGATVSSAATAIRAVTPICAAASRTCVTMGEHLFLRCRTLEQRNRTPTDEGDDRGHALDLECLGDAGALSMSTSTSWNLPACSRVISSSMASVGLDSSERGDHMIMMTGTAWEVDMTSWKFSSSVVVISGMCRPSPAAGAADSSGAGALERADRSTAPCESAGMGVASDAGRGSGVVMVSSLSKQLVLGTMICVVPTTLSRGDDVCAVGENQPGLDEGSSITDTMAYSPPTIWGIPPQSSTECASGSSPGTPQ